ncbi:toll/interleukin-1 receptor domain-containing protein [Longimicrobium terrae]|uniref:TIR domain-containing protein n=1 Tax=Longimicrobium terrae TaxID=1639882 RepID=A0A841GWK3_9BACT|nr:toll/interleukin-1 receptor domain-containing protein [Longimicrobium terrae]MBB4635838.1 hypothetical protein [Longimicrobium terrae]MBB6070234.1 hypothetical protein [Longimicrobium terrae]NNC30738.1 toll/interleukin-1 receptor domain-containing protein [Longimicrobium terrae]
MAEVFLSYASEDRDEIAKPLAELLTQLGVSVWYDETQIRVGDSIRRSIDEGLAICRYGVVVLSPTFLSKHHTRRELDGLAQREVAGEKVILPIWVDVDVMEIRRFSPPLADRKALLWADGLYAVVTELLKIVRPDIHEKLVQKAEHGSIPRVASGQQLARIIGGAHFSYTMNDDFESEEEMELVSSFMQELQDWSDLWGDFDLQDRIRTEYRVSELLNDLHQAGWTVHAARRSGKRIIAGVEDVWTWSEVAVIRGEVSRVSRINEGFVVVRLPT